MRLLEQPSRVCVRFPFRILQVPAEGRGDCARRAGDAILIFFLISVVSARMWTGLVMWVFICEGGEWFGA